MRIIESVFVLFYYMNIFVSYRSISNLIPKSSIFINKLFGTKPRKLRESNQKSSIQLSNNQQKYYDSLISPNISLVVALGPAGSGKT